MQTEKYHRIFISHQTKNKNVAQIIISLLNEFGFPGENIFCSSSPGNDVQEQISKEVFAAIHESNLDIIILSEEYYNSPYCLNEAGIIWYKGNIGNTKVIVVALPEISHSNIAGFINGDYIQYNFSNETDILKFIDNCLESEAKVTNYSRISQTVKEYVQKYNECVLQRAIDLHSKKYNIHDLKSDDEKILLYYYLKNDTTIATKQQLKEWVATEEIEYFNLDNTIAILRQKGILKGNKAAIELRPTFYADINSNRISNLMNFRRCFEYRRQVSSILFDKYWREEKFSEEEKLIFAFFTEQNILEFTFPFDEKTSQRLKDWEYQYNIDTNLEKIINSYIKEYIDNEFFQVARKTDKYVYYHISSVLLSHIRKEYVEQIETIRKRYDLNDIINMFHGK